VDLVLDIKILLLLAAANGAPVLAKKILGQRWARPLDGRRQLADGQPLFGSSKTIRGIVLAVIVTSAAGLAIGMGWHSGLLVAIGAMAGDLLSSFLKRRMRLSPSSMALGLDQIPESLLPTLICAAFLPLSALDIAAIVGMFFVGELFLSRIFYHLHLRDRPY
jgi:CDP-2,3-bis-(O-geranylgeranyl)-sn-glycerol synthase